MILIAPFSKQLKNNMPHAKDYPYWKELLALIKEPVIQIGIEGEQKLAKDFRTNLTIGEIETLILNCRIWISVDSFLPHMAKHLDKPGIVLWSRSDPNIFGYPENINLLKDRKYLRKNQFAVWEAIVLNPDSFVGPDIVYRALYPV